MPNWDTENAWRVFDHMPNWTFQIRIWYSQFWVFPRNATSRCWIRWCFCLSVIKACGSIWSTSQTPTWLHRGRKSDLKYYYWDVNKASKKWKLVRYLEILKGCPIEYLTFFDARNFLSTNHYNLQLLNSI